MGPPPSAGSENSGPTTEPASGPDDGTGPATDPTAASDDADGPAPTDPDERIVSLDALRGFALLGILVINVWYFALPLPAIENPTLFGGFEGLDYLAWLASHVLFEGKFITLFTAIYGAGILLFTASRERNGDPVLPYHYRRTLLLLLIGLGHAYLLWYGDILVVYALCGLWVVLLREWEPRLKALMGLAFVAIPSVLFVSQGLFVEEFPTEVVSQWEPSAAAIESEIDTYQGGWLEQMDHRVETATQAHTSGFLFYSLWRTSGVMLLGMALFEWGVLSNDRSTRFYRRLFVGGGLVGIGLVIAGVWYNTATEWALREALFLGSQFNYWGSLALAASYLAGIVLLCRRAAGSRIVGALSAIGKTAFSNYLLQTVLATSLFYGHGLGWFGTLSRAELVPVVLGIWAIQVPLSVWWVHRFRFGPVEWLWRSLTYRERQPLRRDPGRTD